VTGDADPAAKVPAAAILRRVGAAGSVRAGTWPYDAEHLVAPWHYHDFHKIEYAFQGVVEVETATAHYLLPPQQAVWIPAGLAHRTTLTRVRTVAVFFAPEMVRAATDRAQVLPAAPLIREMIVYGARWPISRPTSDPLADAYFEALARLAVEWLGTEVPLHLPASTDPIIAGIMHHTAAHLPDITVQDVCRQAGISERTLRRRFLAATGITWREYLLHSRLLRAIGLLSEPGPSVLDIAVAVGFDSVSAFTRAFKRYSGETPGAYRRRIISRPF
jgi:AraC-like DNA-binding protein